MPTATKTEFDPTLFASILGEDPAEWKAFIVINLRTFQEGRTKLAQAAEKGDMATVSEVRHALGPSLKQWGTVTLEQALMALETETVGAQWPLLEPEFDDLIEALEGLK